MQNLFEKDMNATVFVLHLSENNYKVSNPKPGEKKFIKSEEMTPFEELEVFLKRTLCYGFFGPAAEAGEKVLLHIYVTGHGYMNAA